VLLTSHKCWKLGTSTCMMRLNIASSHDSFKDGQYILKRRDPPSFNLFCSIHIFIYRRSKATSIKSNQQITLTVIKPQYSLSHIFILCFNNSTFCIMFLWHHLTQRDSILSHIFPHSKFSKILYYKFTKNLLKRLLLFLYVKSVL
jgi:hypothetical protein